MANLMTCEDHDSVVVYVGKSGYKITACPLCGALKEVERLEKELQEEKDDE